MLCFYSETGFWPLYCQISTDLDKILCTPISYGIHLWIDLDRDRCVGGSRPNQNDYVFVILIVHPKSYLETTDRRDFGGKPSEWRCGRVLSWKTPEFCSMGGARSKKAFFRVFRVPFDYRAHSLQETVWKSRLKTSLLLVWRVCDQTFGRSWRVPQSNHQENWKVAYSHT